MMEVVQLNMGYLYYKSWPHFWRSHETCSNHCILGIFHGCSPSILQVPAYIGAQSIGALSTSFTLRLMFESVSNPSITAPSSTVVQALVMEIIVSFVLMFVTSTVATDTRAIGELTGIAVGSTVMISSIFAGRADVLF
eukprot:Gb_37528 [translate_table: standard]